ncbi:MAG: hypothetical protein Q7U73_16930 [Rubrivivax sp.]|nr:hypothetical protein [Rubrivivax sp.]
MNDGPDGPREMQVKLDAPLRHLARSACVALLAVQVAGAWAWDEAIDGDLSNSGLAPTSLVFANGANFVAGTIGRPMTGAEVDRDYFTFTVPVGSLFTAINVLAPTAALGGGSFIALQSGPQVTVPFDTPSAAGLLGWTLYSADDIGGNLLPLMAVASFGSSGFEVPLGAGSYAVWIQETATGTASYNFDFTLTAVPEPATALLWAGGLLALAALRRRSA